MCFMQPAAKMFISMKYSLKKPPDQEMDKTALHASRRLGAQSSVAKLVTRLPDLATWEGPLVT